MTQYTITCWFIIKSWAPQWGHLAQTSWVTRHKKPTPLLYQVSGLFHDLLTARLLLYIGVSRGTFSKFQPETDAFIEISNLTQSLPHNQTPTSKFQVPSTRVKWVDMSRWDSIYSYSWVDEIPSTHTHGWVWVDGISWVWVDGIPSTHIYSI